MLRYIIVGIDPGSTIGIAILGLDGRVIDVFSFRGGISSSDLVKLISLYGKPLIIATDQEMKSSEIVGLLANTSNCRTYHPMKKVNKKEKYKLVKERVSTKRLNSHEVDALFAAIKAYNSIRNKMLNIKRRCREKNIEISEEILAKVILGQPLFR